MATDAATGSGVFRSPLAWAIVTAAFVAVYAFVGITQFSIHRIYRKRLRRTFGLARDGSGAVTRRTRPTSGRGATCPTTTPSW